LIELIFVVIKSRLTKLMFAYKDIFVISLVTNLFQHFIITL